MGWSEEYRGGDPGSKPGMRSRKPGMRIIEAGMDSCVKEEIPGQARDEE